MSDATQGNSRATAEAANAAMKVAVLLSTYNGEKYLSCQLGSLAEQTWSNFVLYVRDDGSTDGTRALLQRYAAERGADKVKLFLEDNVGVTQSFFRLMTLCGDADYLLFCDQDDYWCPDKIVSAITALQSGKSSEPLMYASRAELVDEDLHHLGYMPVPRAIGFGNALVENIATGCTVCLNKAARDLIAGALPAKCLIHDWWAYLVVSALGRVIYDERSFIKYRQHGGNAIGVASGLMAKWLRRIRSFSRRKVTIHEQLAELQLLFGDRLPEPHGCLVDRLLRGKRSFAVRLGLLCTGQVWRQSRLDDWIFRLLLLCGRY